jgi:hypothetical protein
MAVASQFKDTNLATRSTGSTAAAYMLLISRRAYMASYANL